MIKLAPSILSADFTILGEQIKLIEDMGIKMLHIDVMDGMYVPNISFGTPIIKSIRKDSDMIFDVHLMIEEPIRFIEDFKEAGSDIITVHAEACKHLNKTIAYIKELGLKAGVSLNPATPLNVLDYILEELDMVLIMSVNPGFGGQSFIENSLNKITELKSLIDKKNYNIDIQVDGGVNKENVLDIIEAGANVIVAGSAIFNGSITDNINEFSQIFNNR